MNLRALARSSFVRATLIVAPLIALAVVSTVSAQTTTFRNPLNSSGPTPG